MSSNDSSGSAQTVQVYTVLTGAGALTFAGSGTIVLNNNAGSDYTGGSFVTGGGTVQLARANGLGSGPLSIISAVVDLDGVNSTSQARLTRQFVRLDHQQWFQRWHVDGQSVVGRGHNLRRHDRRRDRHVRPRAGGQRHSISNRHEYLQRRHDGYRQHGADRDQQGGASRQFELDRRQRRGVCSCGS